MARTLRIRKDEDAHYHVMSRTSNKAFLFDEAFKGTMVVLLERTAAFSGVELEAYAVMDNHFHALVHIVKPDAPVPEGEVLRRIGILKGDEFAVALASHWAEMRGLGLDVLVDAQLERWRRRMHDLSQFTKTYKELVNIAYKADMKYVGSIWSGRFASTLVEDGPYIATCVRYVELNAVRAGIVRRAIDYPYCTHNSEKAVRGGSPEGSVPENAVPENAAAGAGGIPRGVAEMVMEFGRVAQIGAGKIFGSCAFVAAMIERHSETFGFAHPIPRHVIDTSYASHGHRTAA